MVWSVENRAWLEERLALHQRSIQAQLQQHYDNLISALSQNRPEQNERESSAGTPTGPAPMTPTPLSSVGTPSGSAPMTPQ